MVTVAFLIPTTSRNQNWKSIQEIHLFTTMFPSFLSTETSDYSSRFYLGVDQDDPFYSNTNVQENVLSYMNSFSQVHAEFVIFKDIAKGHLTKMWNQLYKKAYNDECDYFYCCGDDINFTKEGWLEKAIQLLKEHNDIGMTGPSNKNGNTNIVTQTLVSRKHYEIFGYGYPEAIWNWYCDDWINLVYSPNYIYRMDDYPCYNCGGRERYNIVEAKDLCQQLVNEDKKKLEKYLEEHNISPIVQTSIFTTILNTIF